MNGQDEYSNLVLINTVDQKRNFAFNPTFNTEEHR